MSLAAVLLAGASVGLLPAAVAADDAEGTNAPYLVSDVDSPAERMAVARAGVAIEATGANALVVIGDAHQIGAVRELGFAVTALDPDAPYRLDPAPSDLAAPQTAASYDFPPGYEGYHTIAEANAIIAATAQANPGIVRRFSIGTSYGGRTIWAVKVSDNPGVDESEPEVLFDGLHHAREHMSLEMTLAILRWLTDGYGRDTRVTGLVDKREIWIVFAVNPDGAIYDIAGGSFHLWRKNRQPNPGSSYVGTDLNRNYGYRWGCCGGADTSAGSNLYRGPSAWSAPEVRRMRDFIESRVIGGRQQIRTAITFHTSGRLVMWPYGYTHTDVPADMTALDHAVFTTLGRRMAASNGYKPQQGSDLYISSGTSRDWMYGTQRIFVFTFELTVGWYADDSTITSETGRNKAAVLDVIQQAWCPYVVVDRADEACGPLFDDLEIARGWRVDPDGTDTAATGRWQRGDPAATSASGVKQVGTAASGQAAFVTGLAAGSAARANDLDGRTTLRSTPVEIPGGAAPRVRFRYSFAHTASATSHDLLRLRLIEPEGSRVIWQIRGSGLDRDGAWRTATVRLPASAAGETVRLQFEAIDGAADTLVEAAVDDVAVMRS